MRFHKKNNKREKQKTKQEKAYETAIDTRKFEIDLFWKRSLFFWGFIGAALVAYGAFAKKKPELSIVIASFGLVSSLAWTLVNRGSKYWQESWETKVLRLEESVTGKLYANWEDVQTHKNFWLRARKYSVSKLVIALSDYTVLLWLAIIFWDKRETFFPSGVGSAISESGPMYFFWGSLAYCFLILLAGRTSEEKKLIEKNESSSMQNDGQRGSMRRDN